MKGKQLPLIGVVGLALLAAGLIGGGLFLRTRGLPSPEETEEGEALGLSGEASTVVPFDIPIPNSAIPSTVDKTASGIHMILETESPLPNVRTFYKEQMAKEGWEEKSDLHFNKGKNRKVEISLTEGKEEAPPGEPAGKTIIEIIYEGPPQ